MKQIVLCCNAGMSTSMLVTKMQKAAEEMNFECEIFACPVAQLKAKATNADVILLGPQVRFELPKVKKTFPEKPVEAIAPTDYGMMRGDNVLKTAITLMEA
ncbi:MAG: PTS sugar transporter subunit IIB [Eubacteriales bacterium]